MQQVALSEQHAGALEARGIERELAQRYGLATAVSERGGSALILPFVRAGEIVGRKYRTLGPEKRFWQDKGGQRGVAWNEDALRDDSLIGQPLIIAEGEIDALSAIAAGFPRAISVPDGAPAEPVGERESARYAWIDAIRPLLSSERVSEIIIAADGDQPGANLLHDLSVRLGRYRCKWLTYPKRPDDPQSRCKDLNEVLQAFGVRGVVETINRAQWLRVEGVYRMGELPPPPEAPIYDIGFPVLGKHYKARLGDFAVVTGIPSHGKSSWVNDLVCRLVTTHGLNAAFASFEQQPTRDHRRNLRTWYAGKPTTQMSELETLEADQWIDERFCFLVPSEDDDVTVDWLLDRCEAAVVQHGARIVVIDPWNEMDHARSRDESLTEYTGRAIKAFKRFARRFMVHLIVVAHPAKQQRDKDGVYAIPSLYDISDSAHWYNKADLGVIVHKLGPDRSLIRVQKSRYHDEIGVPGEVECQFQFARRRFAEESQ